jgi:flavorubredoxin
MFTKLKNDKLVVLGGLIPLDGRVSWVPAGSTGFQPSNCYLLSERGAAALALGSAAGDSHLLIDSGVALHAQQILDDLAALIGEGGALSVFFTRAEMDCVSNLEPIARSFDIQRLFTGGVINPFDAFEDLNLMALRGRRHQIDAMRSGEGDSLARAASIDIGPSRVLEIEAPLLRLLMTFWGWDAETGTLFTSDTFTHGTIQRPDDSRIIDSTVEDTTTPEQVAGHLFAKYEWLPRATCEPLREWLAAKFDELDPEIIAPSRGCVLRGRDVVRRHLDYMLTALTPQHAGLVRQGA